MPEWPLPPHQRYNNFRPANAEPGAVPWRRRRRTLALIGFAIFCLVYYTSPTRRESYSYTDGVDWSKYAYSQYATDSATLCNAVMVFEALHRLGSKAERVLLYPEQWDTTIESAVDRDSQLLNLAQLEYKVKLHPIKLLAVDGMGMPGSFDHPAQTWDTSITKLLAFNLTHYNRILHVDNDITLLQHLDELFLLPSTPIAMPRAYWSTPSNGAPSLTSLLILLEPNPTELNNLLDTLRSWQADETNAHRDKYDMDLLNSRFGTNALVLPHRPYSLLSAEFRRHEHSAYLGGPASLAPWDPDAELAAAKLVHFSDWPLPKPWIMWPNEGLRETQPDCGGEHMGSCRERVIWKGLYDGFRQRRKEVCKILSVPAPDWEKWKKMEGVQQMKQNLAAGGGGAGGQKSVPHTATRTPPAASVKNEGDGWDTARKGG